MFDRDGLHKVGRPERVHGRTVGMNSGVSRYRPSKASSKFLPSRHQLSSLSSINPLWSAGCRSSPRSTWMCDRDGLQKVDHPDGVHGSTIGMNSELSRYRPSKASSACPAGAVQTGISPIRASIIPSSRSHFYME